MLEHELVLRTHNLSYYTQIKYRLEEFNAVIHVSFFVVCNKNRAFTSSNIKISFACIELNVKKICVSVLCYSLTMRVESRSWLLSSFLLMDGCVYLMFLLSFFLFMDNLFLHREYTFFICTCTIFCCLGVPIIK